MTTVSNIKSFLKINPECQIRTLGIPMSSETAIDGIKEFYIKTRFKSRSELISSLQINLS